MKMKLAIVLEFEIENAKVDQTISEIVGSMIACSIEHDETLSAIAFYLTPEECKASNNPGIPLHLLEI